MAVRTSGTIFLDYNPASVCWVQEKVESKDNCLLIKSTYKDNPFLSEMQIREIEDNQSDANWWKVYGLGEEAFLAEDGVAPVTGTERPDLTGFRELGDVFLFHRDFIGQVY